MTFEFLWKHSIFFENNTQNTMPKSSRRQSFGFSPSTGKVQNFNTLPPRTQAQVLAHDRMLMKKTHNSMLQTIMNDLKRMEHSIEVSRKSPEVFQADMKRRLKAIKKRLSGKKSVSFHPSSKKTSRHRVMR